MLFRSTILLLNKVDRIDEPRLIDAFIEARGGIPISAATGQGTERLLTAIDARLHPHGGAVTLRIPHAHGGALALCYDRGRVVSRSDEPQHVEVRVELPEPLMGSLAVYRV